MRSLCLVLAICLFASLAAQQPARIIIDTEGSVHPWNTLEVNNATENFQFIIVTDRTGGLRPGIFHTAVRKINLLQPEFVLSVGDLITGYTTDSAEIDRQWDEFQGMIGELTMPFFYVPGNHDYINDVMAYKWQERFGKDYYHFLYKDVLFLCLNSEEQKRGSQRGYIGEAQLEYARKALADNPDAKWTLLFMHQPLWDQQEDTGKWPELEKLLTNRKHSVFVGHRHRYVKYEHNNGKYFILATTGGGSSLRGPRFGEFDHVVWVTMTEEGPILANLMLDGIWDENINTEAYFRFASPLMDRANMQLPPFFSTEPNFSSTEMALKLENPSDVPMLAQIDFQSNASLWAAQDQWLDTIPPNSTTVVNVPLRTANGNNISSLSPVQIKGTFTYLPDGQPQLEVHQQISYQPQYLYPLHEAPKKVKVDGDAKDWGDLPFSISEGAKVEADPFSHRGPNDLNARFGISYDKKFLYLIAEVTDDQLEIDAAQTPFRQDGVYFMLDARNKLLSATNDGRQTDYTLQIGISPSTEGDDVGNVFRPLSLPEGTQTYCLRTPSGYRVEIAVPVEWLNKNAGGEWQNVRVNAMISDYDQEGQYISRFYWTPDWRSADHILGSGMFERH